MHRSNSFIRHVIAALALTLVGCGQGTEYATEAPAPATEESAAGGNEFCAEVGRRLAPADCADLRQLADTAEAGAAAFNAPDPMRRGETHTLQLAISYAPAANQAPEGEAAEDAESPPEERTGPADALSVDAGRASPAPNPATPEEVVDPLQGETVQFTPLVGRFMRAELIGTGFEITPLTPTSQEVLRDSVTTWSWRVVAQEGGQRVLTLRTVVEGCTADGQCYPLRSTSQNYDVQVTVGLLGKVQDVLTAAPTWLRLLAGVLTALAVLVGAWFGLRNAFRKGREPA